MKLRVVFFILLLFSLIAAACSAVVQNENAGSLNTVDDLVAAFVTQGIELKKGETLDQHFFSVPAILLDPAETSLQVYAFADEASAQEDAAQVASDGGSVGTTMPFWVDDPHFFRSGKLIVLYVGSDPAFLTALEAILGPQFAGR